MSCDASGFPAPSITWTKHRQGNPVIKAPNTQRSNRNDAGMYVCTANNGVGQAKSATAYVSVQCKYLLYRHECLPENSETTRKIHTKLYPGP